MGPFGFLLMGSCGPVCVGLSLLFFGHHNGKNPCGISKRAVRCGIVLGFFMFSENIKLVWFLILFLLALSH
jgi:hypothetical protein